MTMNRAERRAPAAIITQEQLIAMARGDFGIFVELMFPLLHDGQPLKHAPYIDLVCHVLMRCGQRYRNRVIVNMPPGYMKSLLISVLFVAWRLGVNPAEKSICASYGDDLAHKLGRMTRKVMESPLYREIFPETNLTKAAENFLETKQGGFRYATNVGGDIAGFRADFIIIDDPMQPDDMTSAAAKQKVVDWYVGVIAQRLLVNGVIIVVMHRLAPDDFCGTLEETGDWFVLKLPLIAEQSLRYVDHKKRVLWDTEPGDVLNPNYRDRADADRLKRELGVIFDAHCQQRPRFGGTGMCSIDRLARYRDPPPYELTIHSWDLAATKGGGDWTVCAQFGLAKSAAGVDLLYLIRILRMQIELPDVRAIILEQDKLERPALILMDANGVGLGVYQDLVNGGLKHLTRSDNLIHAKTTNLKVQRFHHTLRYLYDGQILIPGSMPGLESFLAELAQFADGKHDDQVDALTVVGAYRESGCAQQRRQIRALGPGQKRGAGAGATSSIRPSVQVQILRSQLGRRPARGFVALDISYQGAAVMADENRNASTLGGSSRNSSRPRAVAGARAPRGWPRPPPRLALCAMIPTPAD
jgi:phage terminase large subunit-like protein